MIKTILDILDDYSNSSLDIILSDDNLDSNMHASISSQHLKVFESAKLLVKSMVQSPYKKLVSQYIVRPYLYRVSLKSIIIADLVFKSYPDNIMLHISTSSTSSTDANQQLSYLVKIVSKIDKYIHVCKYIIREFFQDAFDSILISKLENKMHATILRCSLSKLFQTMICSSFDINMSSKCENSAEFINIDNSSDIGKERQQPLVALFKYCFLNSMHGDKDSSISQQFRYVLSYFFKIASYNDILTIQKLWIAAVRIQFIDLFQVLLSEPISINADVQFSSKAIEQSRKVINSLLQQISYCKSISQCEFLETGLCRNIADKALYSAFVELCPSKRSILAFCTAIILSCELDLSYDHNVSDEDYINDTSHLINRKIIYINTIIEMLKVRKF